MTMVKELMLHSYLQGLQIFIYGFVAQAYHIKTVITWCLTGEAPLSPIDQLLTIY